MKMRAEEWVLSGRPGRRRTRRGLEFALVETLEPRVVLDSTAGLAGLAVELPSRFSSPEEYKQFLIDRTVAAWKETLGTRYPIGGIFPVGPGGLPRVLATPAPADTTAATGPGYSDTNTQVAGVDEGDIVETDGRFLYILSGSSLKVVDARRPDAPTVVSSMQMAGRPVAEFLQGDRLTIISQNYAYLTPGRPDGPSVVAASLALRPGSTSTAMVQVTELDVSDPASPRVLRQTDLDGDYRDARAVGDRVFVVVSDGLPMPTPESRSTATEVVYETEAEYRARVGAIDAGTLLPQFRATVTAADGTTTEATGPIVAAESISRPSLSQDQSLLSVVVFDARRPGPGPVGSTGLVASYQPFVYMTADHLYLSSSAYVSDSDTGFPGRELTLIRKLELAGDDPTLTAVGAVPGRPLNQFAFDEHEGFLRVATTKSVWDGGLPDLSNALYVLEQQGGSMTTVGAIEDLAPGERVFSARFLGDRGFLVTFRQVDPLFGLDLGDPTAPRVIGELKVPGFSRYLHPLDATHLIGIGRDVDPVTNRVRGLQLSLFDVSDLARPTRTGVFTIEGAWSASEFEHHAFSFFADSGILAIPVSGTAAHPDGSVHPYNALHVFRIDPAGGIDLLGKVLHGTPILRSVAIGDVLFSIAHNDLKASRLQAPSETLGEVALRAPGEPDWYTAPPMILIGPPSIVIPLPIDGTIPEVVNQPPPDPVQPISRRDRRVQRLLILWQRRDRALRTLMSSHPKGANALMKARRQALANVQRKLLGPRPASALRAVALLQEFHQHRLPPPGA